MNQLKITLVSLLSFLFILNSEARIVTISEAELVAKNFIFISGNKFNKALTYNEINFSSPYIFQEDNNPVFYAFPMDPGFIIISAEDNFTPVLGYSYEGRFDFDNAPANYRSFLMSYVRQIVYLRNNQYLGDARVIAAWAELRDTGIQSREIAEEKDVAPLLASIWDQGYPYNILCPEDASGPGGHVWAGCVATAMAQIMYYWRYPQTGTGQHCYTPENSSYGQQCANFGQTTYDWEGMINSVDNRNPFPNAELQYHCAVSVNMDFGVDGSGSQSYFVPQALNQYFRYNNAVYAEKDDYSLTNWINLLKADIDAGKPLYYSGFTDGWSGHAFVCDGYQGDNFHFNFGWSGNSNGYYTLYDVAGFSNYQACVRNFAPSDPNYPYRAQGTRNLTSFSGSISDGSGPAANYNDNATAYWLIDPQTIYDSISSITLTFSSFDLLPGDSVKIYNGGTSSDPLLGAFSGSALPPSRSTTGNRMLIEFKTNGSGNSKGWYAEFSAVSPTWCQGLKQFTEPTGTLSDGSGHFYYQSSATCKYRINPAFANKITLYFNSFDTEEGWDYVTVYDGTTQIASFSGQEIPDPVEAYSGSMFITWTSSVSNNYQGWDAYYEVDNVGINENIPVMNLEVSPVPATDMVRIRFNMEESSALTLSLIDLTGQAVYRENIHQPAGLFERKIDVSSLPSGLYFLQIATGSGSINRKILVN